MKTIWKYPLDLTTDLPTLTLPPNSKFLSVQNQENRPVLYYLVNPKAWDEESLEYIKIRLIATGQPIEDKDLEQLDYLGSTITHNGFLVLHVFKVK